MCLFNPIFFSKIDLCSIKFEQKLRCILQVRLFMPWKWAKRPDESDIQRNSRKYFSPAILFGRHRSFVQNFCGSYFCSEYYYKMNDYYWTLIRALICTFSEFTTAINFSYGPRSKWLFSHSRAPFHFSSFENFALRTCLVVRYCTHTIIVRSAAPEPIGKFETVRIPVCYNWNLLTWVTHVM